LYLQIIRLNKVYKTDKQTLINTWSVNRCLRNINVSCPARENPNRQKNTGEKKTNNNKQNKKTHKTNSLKKEPEKSGLKSQTLSAKMSIF
jgi:hypothetical protein